MLVTLSDVTQACPLSVWTQRRFSTRIDLVNGHSIVIRFSLKDLETLPPWTSESVRANFASLLQEKSNDVCDALAQCINSRLLLEAQKQLRIAEFTNAILTDFRRGSTTKQLTAIGVGILRDMLAEYGDDANLAGWPRFLRLCEAYAEQL